MMDLPAILLRKKMDVHKNQFGHVMILAGSPRMLGAGALAGLAAMRTGAGLVTLGVPQSLNSIMQKKAANILMTLPLNETKAHTVGYAAFEQIKSLFKTFKAIAIGPGLSLEESTQKFVLKIIVDSPCPLVIDADALNALAGRLPLLLKSKTPKILTPHPGEMARLLKKSKTLIEQNRNVITQDFAERYHCTLVLKGYKTVVASPSREIYINTTGNPGMATAGSGDVLTGMIAALLGQGLAPFEAAKYGVYLHGLAGDLAAKDKTRLALIASDIIDYIPMALKYEGYERKRKR